MTMPYKHAPGKGRIFDDRKTRRNPKAPDYTGNGKIECPHCKQAFDQRIAAWLNPPSANHVRSNISLRFEEQKKREEESHAIPKIRKTPTPQKNLDEDIPF